MGLIGDVVRTFAPGLDASDNDLVRGAASVIPGVGSYLGQTRANEANLALQRETNLWSSSEAEKNRQFQERMSSTAMQRSVTDMKAAGLNPLNALPGGASTPSGSTPSLGTAKMENAAQDVSPQILSAITSLAQTKQVNAQTEYVKTQDQAAKATLPYLEAEKVQTLANQFQTQGNLRKDIDVKNQQIKESKEKVDASRRGSNPFFKPSADVQNKIDKTLNSLLDAMSGSMKTNAKPKTGPPPVKEPYIRPGRSHYY